MVEEYVYFHQPVWIWILSAFISWGCIKLWVALSPHSSRCLKSEIKVLVAVAFSLSQACVWPSSPCVLMWSPFLPITFCSTSGQTSTYDFSVQSLSSVQLFATPWIAAHQASLSITNSRTSLRLTSIESVMPSSHLILCCPLLLLPPIPPNIRVFSNESTLCMRWPKYWSFSFSIIPSKEIPWLLERHSLAHSTMYTTTQVFFLEKVLF